MNNEPTTLDTLPTTVPSISAGTWQDRQTTTMVTRYGDVQCTALRENDTMVEAKLVYRGHFYKISYEHCDDQGNLWVYGPDGNTRRILDADSAHDMYRAREAFKPGAPKTYVGPLLDAVADAVRRYLSTCRESVAANRAHEARQALAMKADRYNDAAAKLAALHADYAMALDAFRTLTLDRLEGDA